VFEPLNDSLGKIARGAGIALVGVTSGLLFNFIARLIIARYGLQANYGIFSLALAVLNIATILASLGLHQGATRYIAYFRGKGDSAKMRVTISASIKIPVIASVILSLVIFFTAETIAFTLFHAPDLSLPLKIFAAGIPFFTMIHVLGSIFRGFDLMEPQVIFQYFILNILFLILFAVAIVVHLPFTAVFYAYLAALVITFVALAIYTTRKLPQLTGSIDSMNVKPITKELLLFSLPLMGVAMLHMVITWTDTLMLGYFKPPEIVGLYNAAHPLAHIISVPLTALLLIYTPVATGLYSRNLMPELRRNYTIATKWLMFMVLPIFLILFLFPGTVLKLFFGTGYIPAANALRILSLGFIINNLAGPNGSTLTATGHTRLLMWTVLAATIVNIIMNILLIPPLGIVGAAIASAISITLANIIRTARLYSLYRAQPFSKNLIKPIINCVALAFFIQAIAQHFLTITWWILLILFILYYGIYGLATLFTKSFDKEDIAMLLEVEKRSGINMAPLKKIVKRFL
jgi:O-antigen/teichoic acid export membrane protein